ncbi:helix-turn-helix domain-containing protein [Thalassotalea mangrovi]|uniref:Helix-turn-helix domain-containing protein n=1 Tax=Thalassotalea mangrovi TaxID=2572245 RepID=A0A4U1B362_9GAMM|nr:helix-turn-helix domain-containing protein [Thalassotalea mangrovi]TKB43734.1 helix-turn-helix domain-containing protein [Thalassotalea mangrovi]
MNFEVMRVARMIRKLRLAKGWSQEQLAEFSGLSIRTIQRIESGQKPGLESAKALASVLEVDFEQLRGDEKEMAIVEPRDSLAPDHQRQQERYGFYLNLITFCIIMPILFVVNYWLSPNHYWAYWILAGWILATILYGTLVFDAIGWIQSRFTKSER